MLELLKKRPFIIGGVHACLFTTTDELGLFSANRRLATSTGSAYKDISSNLVCSFVYKLSAAANIHRPGDCIHAMVDMEASG